ncbi:MAG: hypothetical protein WBB37_11240 [bacterium]
MKFQWSILIILEIFTIRLGLSQITEYDSSFLKLDSVYYNYQIIEMDTILIDTLYSPSIKDSDQDFADELKISGIKDFSFDMNQGFDQGLRVYIGGEIEGVGIEGALSDKATSSSTVQISEVEKMSLRVFTKNFDGGLGNLSLKLPFNIQDEIQGARVGIHTTDQDDAVNLSYAVNRGMNKRMYFNGEEGKQSPYFLEGPIIAGSENVYLAQGISKPRLLGVDVDYHIDYEKGILSFTNENIITNNSRIEVEYKQAIDDYPNIYVETDEEIKFKHISLTGLYRRRYDEKENPLTFTLNNEEKDSLSLAGDSSTVFHTYANPSEAGDYIIDNDHFRYVGPDSGQYLVSFFHVGENNGEYIYDPNIKAFLYQGPGFGNYSPIKLLPLPEKDEFYGVGVNLFEAFQLNAYGSTKDKNTFSSIDDNDNFGVGYEVRLEKQLNIFSITGQYISYHDQFNKPQNREEIDYQYRWNTNEPLEELADITIGINPKTFLQIVAGYGIVNRTHERKLMNIRPFFFDFGYEAIDSIDKYYAGFAKKYKKFVLKSIYEYVEQTHFFDYNLQYWIKGNNRIGIAGNYDRDSINRGITTKFHVNTLPLSLSIGHRLYNDTTFLFGNVIVNVQHKYGAIIGNIEQTQRYSQKRDENYIKVDEGAGNYVLDSLTGVYVEKEGGDYIRKVYLLQDFERVINRNYSIEATYRQSILDMIGRFYYTEESDFKSNFGELLIAISKTPYELELDIQQDLINDGRYALYEITNRERVLSVAPSYKSLSGRVEVKEVIERHNVFISETRYSYGGKIAWRILQNPVIRPEFGYTYNEIFSSYFSSSDIVLYEPRTSLLIGLPFKTKGRIELTGELIYRDYNLDDVPYFFAAAEPPGLTKIMTTTASFGYSKNTVLSFIYRIDFSPDNEFRQNLRFQTKIRF